MTGYPKPQVKAKKRLRLKRTTAYDRPEWKALARKVRLRSSGWCEECQQQNATQTHHKSYADFTNWKRLLVPLDQLIHLCENCHKAKHDHMRFT